jgi:spore germination cell wall hydrolase CwlJ-like protein
MIRKPIDALKRADRAVIGAFVLILATAGAAWAYAPPTDGAAASPGPVVALTLEAPVASRPVISGEAVRVIAAPSASQVSDVARALASEQTQCLADAMYYEARGEGLAGEKAIAEVVFNRVRSEWFPHSICSVVREEAGGVCQFTFECDGHMRAAKEPYEWTRARVLAAAIISGVVKLNGETEGAVAYHATYVDPDWGSHLVRTVQIGNHIFYKFASPRWETRGA